MSKGGGKPPRILILQIYSMVSIEKCNKQGETLNVLACIQTYLKSSAINSLSLGSNKEVAMLSSDNYYLQNGLGLLLTEKEPSV